MLFKLKILEHTKANATTSIMLPSTGLSRNNNSVSPCKVKSTGKKKLISKPRQNKTKTIQLY